MSERYQLQQLDAVTPDQAEGSAKAVLGKARAQVGFIPNMYARMVNSPALLETYLHGYNLFRTQSSLSPVEQEVVFLTISRENGCHYCLAAHSTLADKSSGVPAEVTDAIRAGTPLPDARLDALSEFTRVMLDSRGNPTPAQARAFLDAGYSETAMLDIILALAVKTLSNYSNHLFNTPLDEVFAGRRV